MMNHVLHKNAKEVTQLFFKPMISTLGITVGLLAIGYNGTLPLILGYATILLAMCTILAGIHEAIRFQKLKDDKSENQAEEKEEVKLLEYKPRAKPKLTVVK